MQRFTAERAKAFIDAVVAIAMTLLILPLMESVSDAAGAEETAWPWLGDHVYQLISFALSFVIIAMFWIRHHRLFAEVTHVTVPLLWLTIGWLLTIVWLPVATAMSGEMSTEPIVVIVYIGSMVATSIALLAQRLYLRAHPQLHAISSVALRAGLNADVALVLLFAVALAVALLAPAIGYTSLFLLLLAGPFAGLLGRIAPRSSS
ncbi:DUF1211 domain-containing protein [Pseudoclavibacter endophyticus]|uniref:DUF1211 domain-containing protein n=2 Tax=Pseudoclavibacter endophyticus TaxID=1778590 RepID=A0A6H9WQS3_9MICO|nr:DUF1211 domain-containing protein [Pseudoclavibacter endophyticus]